MKKYELYLFDFDGTIVDSLNSLIDIFVLSFRAIDIEIDPKNVLRYTRIPIEQTYDEVHAPWSRAGEFEKALRYYLNDEEVLKKTELYDETIPLLKALRDRGLKFGIVTSNNEKHVMDVLNMYNIPIDWFEIFVDSNKVRDTKPSPAPLLYALKELGYLDNRDKVVYIGDGMNDMLSANAANVDAVLIDRDGSFEESNKYLKIDKLMKILDY